MNIDSRIEWPSCQLSNFANNKFTIDGVICESMEGFLQSLKFADVHEQIRTCKLVGYQAKLYGRLADDWRPSQTLYWLGNPIKRQSDDYKKLITRAYNQLAKNDKFIEALKATGSADLTHDIGCNNPLESILTEQEFIQQLLRLRGDLNQLMMK